MKRSTATRLAAVFLVFLLVFSLAACTKPSVPTPGNTNDPDPAADPNGGKDPEGDKPVQTGPGAPVTDPGTLAGEKPGDIPVALQLNRETVAHQEWFTPDDYGQGMIECRMITAYESLYPVDDRTFSKLAAALGGYFDDMDAMMKDNLEEMDFFRDELTKEELIAYVPAGFAVVDGMYLRFETTVRRADTRVVSFTEELFANVGTDARSFICKNIDTQSGEFLTLDDVLDNKPEAYAFIESEVKRLFGDVELPDEYAFTVDWQGVTLHFDMPELDFIAEVPKVFLSFAEHPDFVKSYYRDVPDAYALPWKVAAENGFDIDGDGDLDRVDIQWERGENFVLYRGGKTWIANFTNDTNPWEGLTDSDVDWALRLYEFDESGPGYLDTYLGKPAGNCLTDPDLIRLLTSVEMLPSSAVGEGMNPYQPVIQPVKVGDDGNLHDAENGAMWEHGGPERRAEVVHCDELFGSWSTSFIADEEGNEVMVHLDFYENGYMYYSLDRGDGVPREVYMGRFRRDHRIPGQQWGYPCVAFVLFPVGGSEYDGEPHQFWSMNTITYPDPDDPSTIRIESEGDLLGHSFGSGNGFGLYELYRSWE